MPSRMFSHLSVQLFFLNLCLALFSLYLSSYLRKAITLGQTVTPSATVWHAPIYALAILCWIAALLPPDTNQASEALCEDFGWAYEVL